MKDSQQIAGFDREMVKYIKANNERFSTERKNDPEKG